MANMRRTETPQQIKEEQKNVTRKIAAWKKQNPTEDIKRIDYLDGVKIDGVKYFYATKSGKVISCKGTAARELRYNVVEKPENGYAAVTLDKSRLVHRIILETFKTDICFFPEGKHITEYEGHHIEDIRDSRGFKINAIDNLMGLPKLLHTSLFNQAAIEGLMSSSAKSFEYMQKVSKYLSGLNTMAIVFPGTGINTKTGEERTDLPQTIIQENEQNNFDNIKQQIMSNFYFKTEPLDEKSRKNFEKLMKTDGEAEKYNDHMMNLLNDLSKIGGIPMGFEIVYKGMELRISIVFFKL